MSGNIKLNESERLISVVNRNKSCKRASFWSPNPARALHIFLKPNSGPKAKFIEWVKIRLTAGYWRWSRVNMAK